MVAKQVALLGHLQQVRHSQDVSIYGQVRKETTNIIFYSFIYSHIIYTIT